MPTNEQGMPTNEQEHAHQRAGACPPTSRSMPTNEQGHAHQQSQCMWMEVDMRQINIQQDYCYSLEHAAEVKAQKCSHNPFEEVITSFCQKSFFPASEPVLLPLTSHKLELWPTVWVRTLFATIYGVIIYLYNYSFHLFI